MSEKQTGFIRRFLQTLFPSRAELRSQRGALFLVMLSALSGGLIFHQNVLGILGWVALAPLFIALHSLRGKLLIWAALTFGFTWYYLSVFWLHTLVVFHWMIPVGVVAGSLYTGAYFILFAVPAAWSCRQVSPILRPWVIATCWTAVEFLRNFTDMAFPWNLLGHSQAPWNPVFMQLASYGGVSLLSFSMALVSGAIAVTIVSLGSESKPLRRAVFVITPAAIFVLAGFMIAMSSPLVKSAPSLRVSIIQPGISQLQRWNAMMGLPGDNTQQIQQRWLETENLMLSTLADLTRNAGNQDKPQLVVMPESIFMSPGFPYATQLQNDLTSLSKEINADLFFGADNLLDQKSYDLASAAGQRFLMPGEAAPVYAIPTMPVLRRDDGTTVPDFNALNTMIPTVAAWHISRSQGIESRVYNKMQLVPFGEQVPYISGIRWLQEKLALAGIAGAYKPGLQNTIFEVRGDAPHGAPARIYRFGSVICFESTFSHLTQQLARAGAEFVCVLTNDSWYDPSYAISQGGFWGTLFRMPGFRQLASAGPDQHLVQSQFRAVEMGRPIVRSANTGISAFIESNGAVTNALPYGESGYLSHTIRIPNEPATTYFVRFGEWAGKLCLGIWAAMLCLLIIARPKSSGSRFALHK